MWLEVRTAHFSKHRLSPWALVKLFTAATCAETSCAFVALVLILSAWENAPRNSPFILRPRFCCFKDDKYKIEQGGGKN